MADSLYEKIKAKLQKAALTTAVAAQTIMGMGIFPHAEKSDDVSHDSKTEQKASRQSQEAAGDILYGAFDQSGENIASSDDFDKSTQTLSDTPQNDDSQISKLEQKYGFDLRYYAENDMFVLFQNGREDAHKLYADNLNHQDWQDRYQKGMQEIFSQDMEFEIVNKDLYKCLSQSVEEQVANNLPKEEAGLTMAYYDRYNILTVIHYDIRAEDYDKCVKLVSDTYGYSQEEATQYVDNLTKENIITQENLAARFSQLEHEDSHRFDHEHNSTFKFDLHPEYMAKLDMLSEIRANAVQAGLAYDMYLATGSMEYFSKLAIDTQELQEALLQNPNMDNPKGYIAQFVYNEWLETYNKAGSTYSESTYDNVSPQKNDDYPLYAFIKTPEAEKQYQERVAAMFENIEGLGDISQYINPEFSLNFDLQDRLDYEVESILNSDNLKTLITQANEGNASQNFSDYVAAVKEVDADGIRTPEEEAQLDKMLQEKLQADKSHDTADISKENQDRIAALRARGNHNQKSATEQASAFNGLPAQQKGNHLNDLRLGKNVFIKPKETTPHPTKEKGKATSPATNTADAQNIVLSTKKQQNQHT